MFYARTDELKKLNDRYAKNNFECVVLYGRRRVGKTALISEFCKDKTTIFFSALQDETEKRNLENLSKIIQNFKYPNLDSAPIYKDFSNAFDEITELAKKQKIIFVIDEYPYLAKSCPVLSSVLQHLIDHTWKDLNMMLILCGSSMNFMEKQVLGYESPLYGRRTAQFKILPLRYDEVSYFFPTLSKADLSLIYGITGGIPHYLNKLNIEKDLDTSLLENLFDSASYLYEEPTNLLKQELREPTLYNAIIDAIAKGSSKINEIATHCSLENAIIAKYLTILMDLNIIVKEKPLGEKNHKKTIYKIDDPFFRFWYKFIQPYKSIIESNKISLFYEKMIKPCFNDYMGLIFEKMSKDYLLYKTDELITEIGQWWGTDNKSKKQIQIDIMAKTPNYYIVGSCKYKNEPVSVQELNILKEYANAFNPKNKYKYYLFSKSGFTPSLQNENADVVCVSLDKMY